jgi:hypothetical protein
MVALHVASSAEEAAEELTVEWVHRLYPESLQISGFQGIRNWWIENAIPWVIEEFAEDGISNAVVRGAAEEIRIDAFNAIRRSCERLASMRSFLKGLDATLVAQGMHDNPDCYRNYVVAVVGSTGRRESDIKGDVDLNYIYECVAKFECKKLLKELIADTLTGEFARASTPLDGKKVSFVIENKDERYFDTGKLMPPERMDQFKTDYALNLLIGSFAIRGDSMLEEIRRQFLNHVEEYRPGFSIAMLSRAEKPYEVMKDEAETRDISQCAEYAYKVISRVLISLAVYYLPPPTWERNYLLLAETLREENDIDAGYWPSVRSALIWSTKWRGKERKEIDDADYAYLLKLLNTFYKLMKKHRIALSTQGVR